ncbi:ADP-heptose:LPS heptosyltransferase II [Citrobacter koseri]|nr:ADP-heptose:LPS heptosyltransferase II [Citrobacter koseri]STT22903.1 ADP-heptose-lipooligosaccharide heptosyltransferase II [Citrobacter koseri]
MGDTLYLLAACRAIKNKTGASIIMLSQPHFSALARACPHISEVWPVDSLSAEQHQCIQRAQAQGRLFDFTHWAHALRPRHMIDAFLAQAGLEASAADKHLDLVIPESAHSAVDAFWQQHKLENAPVLLMHPNIGHPNRTWPQNNWHELAQMWLQTGWQVVFIGSNNNSEAGKSMAEAYPAGVIYAIDRFSALETVALMQRANMLVSCDSGPVMLAAATDIPVVALYSTVAAEHRLPFRRGEAGWRCMGIDLACSHGPCARLLMNDVIFTTVLKRPFDVPTTQEFANWCVHKTPFRCLRQYEPAMLYTQMVSFVLSLQE